jgi:hypothetical protein
MTVKELIDQLSKLDPHLSVCTPDCEWGENSIHRAIMIKSVEDGKEICLLDGWVGVVNYDR